MKLKFKVGDCIKNSKEFTTQNRKRIQKNSTILILETSNKIYKNDIGIITVKILVNDEIYKLKFYSLEKDIETINSYFGNNLID